MKKFQLLLFSILSPFLIFAQLEIYECPKPEKEELSLDEKFDKFLGTYTNPFVGKVFYSIPFKTLEVEKKINFSNKESYANYNFCKSNDSIFISSINVNNEYEADEVELISKAENIYSYNDNQILIVGDLPNVLSFNAIKVTVGIPWVLFPLILGALFFTIYFMFPGIRFFRTAIRTVKGDFEHVEELPSDLNVVDGDNPDTIRVEGNEGEVSHFQALTAALSATVGLGNIAGVAVAISIGGAGATFWMILAGLLGMASKFVECTLGVKYREIDENGKVYGGPMYYLTKGLKEKGLGGLGKVLAVLFAIMCIGGSFGGGNMFQANQSFKMLEFVTGAESSFLYERGWLYGLIMAILVGVVIIGGIKSIAKVTEKIVPFMAGIYFLAAIVVIVMNISILPSAVSEIITSAFAPTAVAGGLVGVIVQGFKRAAFSNEAGIGSAAIAHSAVKTKHPASEGIVALLEPFIDTVVICTLTALVIVITGRHTMLDKIAEMNPQFAGDNDSLGVLLTSSAFESSISWFPYILTLAVVLFAFSSMISWSYYGLQSWTFLFGKSKRNEYIYKIMFCIFVVIGAAAKMGNVLGFSDAMIFAMMVPNMIGLVILVPVVKKELDKYLAAIKNK